MSRQDNIVILSLFAAHLALILLLRHLQGAAVLAREETYLFLLEHPLGMLIAQLPVAIITIIPLIVGVVSMACVLLLCARIGASQNTTRLTALFVALTPVMTTTFVTYSEALFFVPLILVSLLIDKRLAFIPLTLSVLISPLAGIITSILLGGYFLQQNKLYSAASTLIPLVLGITFFEGQSFVWIPLFGEFASINGYSLFLVVLGVVAVIEHWKKLNITLVLLWTVLFLVSGYLVEARILVALSLAIYASESIIRLFKEEWVLSFLKDASKILLLCVALFVFITHNQALLNEHPNKDVVFLVEDIRESHRLGTVLTTQRLQAYTRYASEREIIYFPPEHPFWTTVRLTEAGPVITGNDVRYILLEQRIRETGFFFLLTTNDKFIRVHTRGNYESWVVLQEFVPVGE